MNHQTIFRQEQTYCSFPHLARHPDGRLLLVFRQAGGETAAQALLGQHTHQDLDSRILLMQSADEGQTWSEPITVFAGDAASGLAPSDPAITILQDQRLLVRYALWKLVPSAQRQRITGEIHRHFVRRGWVGQLLGNGFSVSGDAGQNWQTIPTQGYPLGVVSREAVLQADDGTLLLSAYGGYPHSTEKAYLQRSFDGGVTWGDASRIAADPHPQAAYRTHANYNEAAVVFLDETTLLALVRVDRAFFTSDATFMSEGGIGELEWTVSYDLGFTWEAPQKTGIWGQPAHLLRLNDGRLLSTHGYRAQPYGVRAAWAQFSPAFGWQTLGATILRDDAAGWDVGYPASVQLADDSILSVYYLHGADGVRYIAGTRWRLP